MQTRGQACRKAWQAAAVTDYSQRDWEVGSLLAESRSLLHSTPDRLNNIVTCGRDIAVLACVNRCVCRAAQQQQRAVLLHTGPCPTLCATGPDRPFWNPVT